MNIINHHPMRAFNWFFKKVVKIRVEGPLDSKIEQRIIQQLNSIKPNNARALIIIINSYGGSLRAAKNISHAIDELRSKEIPVYCFAQEFCLNSANIILTSGTRCFAHKLSILGDFGYVYENYSFDEFNKRYNVGLETVSNAESKIEAVSKLYQFKDGKFITKMVSDKADELKLEVLTNRLDQLKCKNIEPSTFESKILRGGTINPNQAIELGLIDGLQSHNQFIRSHFSNVRIKYTKQFREYKVINFIRSVLEIFKQE